MKQPVLILASGSPRRQELIRTLGLPYRVDAADVDESMPEGTPPDKLVERLSLRKAGTVGARSREEREAIVIGSDTVVVLDGIILGKPKDEQDAFDTLRRIAGRTHQVYTGLALLSVAAGEMATWSTMDGELAAGGTDSGDKGSVIRFGDTGVYRIWSRTQSGNPQAMVGHTVSHVTFRPMSDDEIWAYVRTGEPLDKAGSYGVQGLGAVFIEKIEGDFYSVMGLPLSLLYQMLVRFGLRPFGQSED
ncbi:Maf family protein [Paenibacillus ginsengarvi]|uniref:dTTP/UTP pyrophosphatase n=1 Tax=Paenibacillus ginsengarvi TaxID=400777 RepID=A0A3B0CHT9_9BACL|nr:Maf family protein [Paenibacillus ginsengarvi]RKN83857.1 Maf-like protein [Paenibacillus ginsengarvi]